MKKTHRTLIVALIGLLIALPVLAQGEGKEAGKAPTFGPPPEMSQLAPFIGTWKFQGEMRMDPSAAWTPNTATVVNSLVCGGAAMQTDFSGPMMGMEMKGLSLTGFDREIKKWQTIWTDNLAGRISYYEGDFKDGRLVTSGKDLMNGVTMYSRSTYYDITDKTIKWTMESSMDGQTWYVSMQGTYTKQ